MHNNNSYKFSKNSVISCLESKSRTYFKVLNVNNKLKHLNNQTKLFRHGNKRECLTINITQDEPRIVIVNNINKNKSNKLQNVAVRKLHDFEQDWNEREI